MQNKKPLQVVLLLIVIGVVYGGKYLYEQLELQGVTTGTGAGTGDTSVVVETPPAARGPSSSGTATIPAPQPTGTTTTNDDRRIAKAFADGQSDLMVETEGVVQRSLPDDREGSAHQRFVVRLANGHTVLIAHNIDLASRVPIDEGDRVRFRGEYEWNDRGGVIHWTHHDPKGWREGGWIEFDGQRYE